MKRLMFAGLLLLLAGCGGGGSSGGMMESPPPINVSGQWDVVVNETLDTCGIPAPNISAPLLIEQRGNTAIVTVIDPFGFCIPFTYSLSGGTLTLQRTDRVLAGTCEYDVTVDSVLVFSGSTFTGTETNHFSFIAGTCSGTCDWNLSVAGTRCANCWPGCVAPALSVQTLGGPTTKGLRIVPKQTQ